MEPLSESPSSTEPQDDHYGGLASHYDVILCGTSLTNSILASALARAGFSVLHCDAADYYGELDAVWTLPYIMNEYQNKQSGNGSETVPVTEATNEDMQQQQTDGSSTSLAVSPLGAAQSLSLKSLLSRTEPEQYPFTIGIPVDTPYGFGTVQSITQGTSVGATNIRIQLDKWGASLYISVPIADENDLANFVFDKHGILHATCKSARQLLLQHSRAFALDITPALVFCSGPAVQGLLTSGVAEYLEFKAIQGMLFGKDLQTVPCNKSDVFASKLLKAMDKRRLMSFLQLAMDYAIAQEMSHEIENEGAQEEVSEAAVVESLNERHLNQGRALRRPQNKPVATNEMQALQRSMESGISFHEYLKQQKLSDSLIELIRYAMALEIGGQGDREVSLQEGLNSLGRHLIALGRFGTTAFLATLYGSGELPQAFCRSAAVFGATYMLRTAIRTISWEAHGDDDDDEKKKPLTVTVERRDDQQLRTFSCSHTVVSQQSLRHAAPARRVWRRISVLSCKPIPDGQQRHVIILPPNTVSDYPYVIQGIVLDNGVNVAPYAPSNSLLHLTTTAPLSSENIETVLESAVAAILDRASEHSLMKEIFQATFTYNLVDPVATPTHRGVHLIPSVAPGLAVDDAFDQARSIFETICPDISFLTVAEKVTNAIEERLGSAALHAPEDTEQAVLEQAILIAKRNEAWKQWTLKQYHRTNRKM